MDPGVESSRSVPQGAGRFSHTGTVRFIAWAGAGTGRLPLWLEGRAAS